MSANYARVIQRKKAAANRPASRPLKSVCKASAVIGRKAAATVSAKIAAKTSAKSSAKASSKASSRASSTLISNLSARVSAKSKRSTSRPAVQIVSTKNHSLNARAKSRTAKRAAKRATASLSFTWPERTLIGMISVSAICIGLALIMDFSFNPQRDAEHALERLARDYYTEYLYPNTIGDQTEQPGNILANFVNQGYPTVRLRQLLHYHDDAKIEMSKYFDNKYYHCDTNGTTLRYFPVEPYGPKDYKVTYSYSCTDLRADSVQAQGDSSSIRVIEK